MISTALPLKSPYGNVAACVRRGPAPSREQINADRMFFRGYETVAICAMRRRRGQDNLPHTSHARIRGLVKVDEGAPASPARRGDRMIVGAMSVNDDPVDRPVLALVGAGGRVPVSAPASAVRLLSRPLAGRYRNPVKESAGEVEVDPRGFGGVPDRGSLLSLAWRVFSLPRCRSDLVRHTRETGVRLGRHFGMQCTSRSPRNDR